MKTKSKITALLTAGFSSGNIAQKKRYNSLVKNGKNNSGKPMSKSALLYR